MLLVAGPRLLWQMIGYAKARGAATFDFWGVIPDDNPSHPWAGFSRFKKAFGGRLLERAGTWELPVRMARYRAYAARSEERRVGNGGRGGVGRAAGRERREERGGGG